MLANAVCWTRSVKSWSGITNCLSYLLDHSPALHTGSDGFEQVIMMLDFNLMKAFYSTVSVLSRQAPAARFRK